MNESGAPALKRGLDILEIISLSQSIGFNSLKQESGLNTSSLNRILKVLINEDYIIKNGEGKYELGMKLFTISYGNSTWQPLMSNISKILHDISAKFDVTALFNVFLYSGGYVIDKVICPDNVSMRPVGDIASDYARTPWGLLYLAEMGDGERNEFIKEHKDIFPGDGYLHGAVFEDFIKFIKENGYSDDKNMIQKNMRRFAAPVYGKNGKITAAIAVGTFVNLIDDAKAVIIAGELMRNAAALSEIIQGKY